MAQSLHEMRALWKKLRIANDVNDASVSEEIRASWNRSIEHGVSPFLKTNKNVLTPAELIRRKGANEELLTRAQPIINSLYEFVKGTGFIVALADREGFLLVTIGDEEGLEFARRANFIEGAKWTEDAIGTNAVGLALVLKKPIQVYGYEHFCICAYNATCSAAPIHDPDGNLIGVLDLTGPYEKAHIHTLGMVVAGAAAIENQIALYRAYQESRLANQRKTIIMESMSEGVIAIDNSGYITHINKPAAILLNLDREQALGQNLAAVFGQDEESNYSFINLVRSKKEVTDSSVIITRARSKIHCNISCRSLNDTEGKILGRVVILQNVKRFNRLITRIVGAQAKMTFNDLIGQNEHFINAVRLARAAAVSDCNVLLLGESGTGKDLFAQAIHNASTRANQPFLAINCGAIPRELIASELFGYDEGAFTGARKGGKPGKFELADQGTIFLDEIGEMPLDLQTTLLRVLEERQVTRVGGQEYIPVDVRIIAATNKDLVAEIEKGNFRRDLFYRLNVMTIPLPPLRIRKDDIKLLALHFLKKIKERLGKEVQFDEEIFPLLLNYNWPGNVRELQNLIERAINLATKPIITKDLFPFEFSHHVFQSSFPKETGEFDSPSLKVTEEQMIRSYLAKYQNKKIVAKQLGISRSTLYRKLQKYGIER